MKMMDQLDKMLSVDIPRLMDTLPHDLSRVGGVGEGLAGSNLGGGRKGAQMALKTQMPDVITPVTHKVNDVKLEEEVKPPAPPSVSEAAEADSNPFGEDEEDEDANPFGRPTEEDDEPWELQDEKDLKWDDLFKEVGAKEGKLAAGPARKALMATGVATSKLRHIWDLSDIDKDGSLDAEEFTIAMHLCELVNGGEEAPDVLEVGKVPKSKRK